MRILFLWVILCLPTFAHAQNTIDAFLQYFEDMDGENYKYRLTPIEKIVGAQKILPTALYEPLYTRNPRFELSYAKENFTVYPIGKVKNSEGIYSVVYLEVAKRENAHGNVYYLGELLITTIDVNDKNARLNSITLDKRGGQQDWESFTQPYHAIAVDYFVRSKLLYFSNVNEQGGSATFAFDAKNKTYEKK